MTDQRPAVFMPTVYYQDPQAALAWLGRAFGFETSMLVEETDGDDRIVHSEMSYLDARISVGGEWADTTRSPKSLGGANTQRVSVTVESDIDAHFARARDAGAVVLQEPRDELYGDRTYRVRDPEGHTWTFRQAVRSISVAEMEAASGLRIKLSR